MATSNSTITIDDGDDNSANTSSNKKRKFEVSKGRPKDSFVWSYIEDHGDYRICKIKVNVSSENPDGWNSAYYSWQRLILLKDAITHLPSRYQSDQNKEVRKEANKLERILLSESEWILMNDLVVVLKDFEEITRKLSGATYITFSLIYPSIYTLIKKLQEMLPESSHLSIDNEFEDSSEQLQLDEQEDVFNIQDILEDEEADEILILDSNTKKKINISSSIETDGLKDLIIEALLIYLKKYWDAPSDLSMVATILDPRLKKLSIFEEKDVKTTIFNLKEEYEISCSNNLQNEACEDSESLIDLRNNDAFGSFGSSIFSIDGCIHSFWIKVMAERQVSLKELKVDAEVCGLKAEQCLTITTVATKQVEEYILSTTLDRIEKRPLYTELTTDDEEFDEESMFFEPSNITKIQEIVVETIERTIEVATTCP
ncbi:14672_t:CDS:2 [Entrophospora sp. SA101]|nr:14672_t:CDS:2 [Entrophospora sp. SA101]